MKEKYCLITYSHRNCSDLWEGYYGRLEKYAPKGLKNYLLVDDSFSEYPFLKNVPEMILYNEKEQPFSVQWLNAAMKAESDGYDYFIYSQEDFVLYDLVNESAIHDAIEKIESKQTDFVKFIKSGGTEYCMQASIHNIKKFISFYSKYQIDSIREEGFLSKCSIGEYECKYLPDSWVGQKRGVFHYDSKVWPYIATALVKGNWNMKEYKKELTDFKNEYISEFTDLRGNFE